MLEERDNSEGTGDEEVRYQYSRGAVMHPDELEVLSVERLLLP